jgi:hypothetical protein
MTVALSVAVVALLLGWSPGVTLILVALVLLVVHRLAPTLVESLARPRRR